MANLTRPRTLRRPFVVTKMGQLLRVVRESHEIPMTGVSRPPERVPADELGVTFIGHSSFLLQIDGKNILIDPVLSKRLIVLRRLRRPGVAAEQMPPIDLVLVTHAHMDHLDIASLRQVIRTTRRLAGRTPEVVVPNGVEDLVSHLRFARVHRMEWWQRLRVKGLEITMTPCRHWGARMFNDTHRGYGGYVIEGAGHSVYHSGDTAYFSGFAEIGRRLNPQVALLPIGAYFPDSYRAVHTSPEEAVQAFRDLGAESMVPMHFGTFRLGREPMHEPVERLRAEARRLGITDRVRVLGEGETMRVSAPVGILWGMSTAQAVNASASGTFVLGGDLPVHRLGYGAMRITGKGIWGEPTDPEAAKKVLRRAVELGVNFIDTADSYGPEVSERLIGEALAPYSKGVVIATKGGLTRQGPDRWLPVGRPEYLQQEVEMSLRRLKLERLDLWQLHRIDPKVPLEESLGIIKKLQEQGKIRHVGLSEVKPPEIDQARKVVDIVSVQNEYNIGDRKHEDVLEYCEKHKLGFIPWFPVASGKLAQPGGKLGAAAKRHGATVSQLSLAWLLHRSPAMLPIPGTSSVEHLEENIAAASVKLNDAEWKEIEDSAK